MFFNRTFHPDEANQAFTTARLLETGQYTYRPDDHHGPTLYYAAAAIQKAAGHDALATMDGTLLRCTPLVFAVLALLFGFLAIRKLMKPLAGFFGWLVPGLFVLLLGTSPIFAFFATDFIQEMLLVCFTLMMFWAGIGYIHAPRATNHETRNTNHEPRNTKLKPGSWALFFGTAASLAFATKETCALSFAAAAVAAAPFLVKRLSLDALRARARDIVLAVLGFFVIAFILYSDFGRDFHGVYNAFIAAPCAYLGRAAGSAASAGAADHVHPWWQYLQWLFSDEYRLLALFIACGIGLGLFTRFAWVKIRPAAREKANSALMRTFLFAQSYALLLLLFYSLIPYKTPWCALQIHTALIVAALLGFAVAGHVFSTLPLIVASLALLFGNGRQLVRMNRDPDSKEIPYNYASASPDVQKLAATVADAVKAADSHTLTPSNSQTFIAVALPPADTWPFPWYNRSYEPQTGYWTSFDDLKRLAETDIKPTAVIVPMEEGHLVQAIFPHLRHTKRFYMRPGVRNKKGKTRGGVRVRVFW